MDLIVWALLLYLAQCFAALPGGAVAFVGTPLGVRALRGPGLQLLSPWPSALGVVLAPRPFRLERGALRSEQSLRRFGTEPFGVTPRAVRLAETAGAEASGGVVRAQGRPFVRAASSEQARVLAGLVERLAAGPGAPADALDAWDAASLDLDDFRATLSESRRAVRSLARTCDAYLVLAFAVTPALALWRDPELALTWVAAPVAALHLLGLALLARAHATLGVTEGRFESLITAALYPPILLRSPSVLLRGSVARFHPAVAAAALLDGESRSAFLRRAQARLLVGADREEGAARQVERLRALAEAAGVSSESLDSPPRIPGADRYCPMCEDGFRAGFGSCETCGVSTLPYPEQPSSEGGGATPSGHRA